MTPAERIAASNRIAADTYPPAPVLREPLRLPLDAIEAIADRAGVGVHDDGDGGFGCAITLADGSALVLLSEPPRPCHHAVYIDGRCVLCSADEPTGGAA